VLARRIQNSDCGISNGKIFPVECDITNPEEISTALIQIHGALGSIDLLINNAGLYIESKIHNTTDSELIRLVNLNVLGLMLVTKRCLSDLERNAT
jgi:NADP-dependent 3-hydroxy acid dehydrogenase YdfG